MTAAPPIDLVVVHSHGFDIGVGNICRVIDVWKRDGDCNNILTLEVICGRQVGRMAEIDCGYCASVREALIQGFESSFFLYPDS